MKQNCFFASSSTWRKFWRKTWILNESAKSKYLSCSLWCLRSVFEGLRPSNTIFKDQHEFLKIFDFALSFKIYIFLQNLLQIESSQRSNSVSISIIWLGIDFISQLSSQFPSIYWILIKTESSWILRIFDSKLYYFSSDLSCVNIAQIEIHQNMEMERNTWTLCFR